MKIRTVLFTIFNFSESYGTHLICNKLVSSYIWTHIAILLSQNSMKDTYI